MTKSSLVVVLEGTEAGFKRIESLLKARKLREIAGLRVMRVSRESDVQTGRILKKQNSDTESRDILHRVRDRTLKKLSPLLEQGYSYQRELVRNLGDIGDPKAVKLLLDRLADRSERVQAAAVEALSKIGETAVEPLISALANENKFVRFRAALALGQIGDRRAVKPLINALRDDIGIVRDGAVRALGKIRDPIAIEPLIEISDREIPSMGPTLATPEGEGIVHGFQPTRIAQALAEIGEPAVERLISTLGTKDVLVRITAIQALGIICDRRSVGPLIHALKAEEAWVREIAAEALGNLRDMSAMGPLQQALRDDHEGVRRTAARAIRNITGLDPPPRENPLQRSSKRFGS